jgi:RES domain
VRATIPLSYCQRVSLPKGGLYRATDWHFPPPPPDPLGASNADSGDRWDDPDGVFSTLYCASRAETAVGEKLADFRLNTTAVARVEKFFDDEPDPEYVDDQLLRVLDRGDIESFGWSLAWAPCRSGVRALDVHHWKTATAPAAAKLLIRNGLRDLDLPALLDIRRSFTRRLAGLWRAASTTATGQLMVCGLRYRSRLPPANWFCWALWEPVPVDATASTTEAITIEHPALRSAARLLGVALAEKSPIRLISTHFTIHERSDRARGLGGLCRRSCPRWGSAPRTPTRAGGAEGAEVTDFGDDQRRDVAADAGDLTEQRARPSVFARGRSLGRRCRSRG